MILERKYTRKMTLALRKQFASVVDFTDIVTNPDSVIRSIDMVVIDEPIWDMFKELYSDSGNKFRKLVVKEVKSLEDDLWKEEMINYVNNNLGDDITNITNYTKESIQTALKNTLDESIEEGLSQTEIMKKFRETLTKGKYSRFTKSRALTIVRTETTKATNVASLESAKRFTTATIKKWLPPPIGIARVQERHAILPGLRGQKRMLDQPFLVDGTSMMHPGDPSGGAQNVINCRCAMTYETV